MGEAKRRKNAEAQERIDLFGDGSGVTATICRPERRSLLHRNHADDIASAILKAAPARLCLDFTCPNEIHLLDGVFVFVSSMTGASPMIAMACQACSEKSDDEILKIIRAQMADHLHIDRATDADRDGFIINVAGIKRTIHGIPLFIIDGNTAPSCKAAEIMSRLLAARRLPRFAFAFPGHNNCFSITGELRLDFRHLGIEDLFEYKIGFSSILKRSGEPTGWHSWIECDGWVIDGASGSVGKPLLFQQTQAYYDLLKITDIKDNNDDTLELIISGGEVGS